MNRSSLRERFVLNNNVVYTFPRYILCLIYYFFFSPFQSPCLSVQFLPGDWVRGGNSSLNLNKNVQFMLKIQRERKVSLVPLGAVRQRRRCRRPRARYRRSGTRRRRTGSLPGPNSPRAPARNTTLPPFLPCLCLADLTVSRREQNAEDAPLFAQHTHFGF